jgi:hypothetical protein
MLRDLIRPLYHKIPDPLRHRIDARRRKPYWVSSGVIFIHVPKAAGTSISHAIYGRSLGHLKAREVKSACPREFASLFRFSVVRDPWDRTLSAYRFVAGGGTTVAGVRRVGQYQFSSFENFLFDWLAHQDLKRADYVFQPQSDFLLDRSGELLVDHVGRFEAIEETIGLASRILGRELEVGRLNALSEGEDYRPFYTSGEAIELVGRVYRDDIERFGYRNRF